jgi:catechol 2,3-dioxygenase-like lactoylglutathione lyase family enzyme
LSCGAAARQHARVAVGSMNPIRAATLAVRDLDTAVTRFRSVLDYREIERGIVDPALAHALDASAIKGARQAVLRPASGRTTDLRLIEAPTSMEGPSVMASLGWTALEICVADVHAMHRRVVDGPFAVVGAPNAIVGLPTIHPMQIQGTDGEVIFLTQILTDDPAAGLPVAQAPVDVLFIVVLACRDLTATAAWVTSQLGTPVADPVDIPYRTLSRAFGLPLDQRHRIATADNGGQIFLQLDQYPPTASVRARLPGGLARGVAMVTLLHPDLDIVPGPWRVSPTPRTGAVYEGRRAGVLEMPDNVLIELVEQA